MQAPIDFSNPRLWLDMLQIVCIGVMALVMFARRPGEEASKDLAALDKRVVVLEQKIGNVATTTDLAKLAGLVQVIESQGEALADRLAVMSGQLTRMEAYLLESK